MNDNNKLLAPPSGSHEGISLAPKVSSWRECLPWLLVIITINLLLVTADGYSADIDYWKTWIEQLQSGYATFYGDYPPVYIHWLYVVGKLYSWLSIPPEANGLLKFFAQIPVMMSHAVLALLIVLWAKRYQVSATLTHAVLALACFSPALLVDGPLWGQVDLLPVTIALGALTLAIHNKRMDLAVPLYILALLIKFQMIALAPVFALLGLQQFKKSLWGVVWAALVALLVFLPFMMVGTAKQTFINAYINTLGSYPHATLNAANLWLLWAGNVAPDDINLITGERGGPWVVKNIGMLLFASVCILVFVVGALRQLRGKATGVAAARDWLLYTLILNLAFFALLPAMHERYLVPAVVVVLFYALLTPSAYLLALLLSLLSAANMLLVFSLSGDLLWQALAAACVLMFVALLLSILLGHNRTARLAQNTVAALQKPWLTLTIMALILGITGLYLNRSYAVHYPLLEDNQQLLREFPLRQNQQSHGAMRFNKSFDGNILSVSGKRYGEGIGVHSKSILVFALPANAQRLSIMAGLDDEVNLAEVEFLLQNNSEILWRSGPVYGYEAEPIVADIDVQGVLEISLLVLSRGDENWDHANWLNPIVTLSP